MSPRTFLTAWEFLWYNCSAVCGSSTLWLYGRINGDLLQETLSYRLCEQVAALRTPAPVTGHFCSVLPQEVWLKQRSGSVSVGSLGPGVHEVLFEPSKHLWWVWDLILNTILPLLPSCHGFSFVVGYLFSGGIQYSPVNGCSAMGSILGSRGSPGGGHSNPLQYSCLENPTNRGAWQATVYRVAQSWTWLKRLSMHTHRTVTNIIL